MRRENLGKRKHKRVSLKRPALIFTDPYGRGQECYIVDISQGGVCLHVGNVALRQVFVLQFSPQVRRLCKVQWRAGDRVGASFVNLEQREFQTEASAYTDSDYISV